MKYNGITRWLILMAFMLSSTGCRVFWRDDCCQVDTSVADAKPQIDPCRNTGEIVTCYESIEDWDNVGQFSLQNFLDGQDVALELKECCCIAAINSPLADVIDKERKAACCTIGYNRCLDRFLAGQALQQRNKSAATAGELYLKLVELHLQRQLIESSFERMSEFREASRFAAEQGLATDEADKELDANEIDLNRKLLEIEEKQLEITIKLSAVLGIERGCLKIVQPIFELFPVYEEVCLEQEVDEALSRRPDLKSFNSRCGSVDPECFAILNQLNPGLGIGVVARIKKCILLNRILNNNDPANKVRRQQLEKLKFVRQDLVRVQVTDAIIDIEAGYRRLVLENEDLERLRNRMSALETAAELDPKQAYIETVQNWVEQQSVRSQRITMAVDFEIAKIKLLEVTGRWTEICGIPGISDSSDCTCRCGGR